MTHGFLMVRDASLFCALAEELRLAVVEDASPKLHFEAIARAWRPIADLLGIDEETATLVIDPLLTATRSYEHDQALCAWATRASALLSADTSVAALKRVADQLPVPHVHRGRLDPKKLGPFTRQLDLFPPLSYSG